MDLALITLASANTTKLHTTHFFISSFLSSLCNRYSSFPDTLQRSLRGTYSLCHYWPMLRTKSPKDPSLAISCATTYASQLHPKVSTRPGAHCHKREVWQPGEGASQTDDEEGDASDGRRNLLVLPDDEVSTRDCLKSFGLISVSDSTGRASSLTEGDASDGQTELS